MKDKTRFVVRVSEEAFDLVRRTASAAKQELGLAADQLILRVTPGAGGLDREAVRLVREYATLKGIEYTEALNALVKTGFSRLEALRKYGSKQKPRKSQPEA